MSCLKSLIREILQSEHPERISQLIHKSKTGDGETAKREFGNMMKIKMNDIFQQHFPEEYLMIELCWIGVAQLKRDGGIHPSVLNKYRLFLNRPQETPVWKDHELLSNTAVSFRIKSPFYKTAKRKADRQYPARDPVCESSMLKVKEISLVPTQQRSLKRLKSLQNDTSLNAEYIRFDDRVSAIENNNIRQIPSFLSQHRRDLGTFEYSYRCQLFKGVLRKRDSMKKSPRSLLIRSFGVPQLPNGINCGVGDGIVQVSSVDGVNHLRSLSIHKLLLNVSFKITSPIELFVTLQYLIDGRCKDLTVDDAEDAIDSLRVSLEQSKDNRSKLAEELQVASDLLTSGD